MRSVVPIQLRESSNSPLFLVHGGGGDVMTYVQFARSLNTRTVYGIHAGAWQPFEFHMLTVPRMAARYIYEMRMIQPVGPYYLGGTCAGALLAYEMAVQLSSENQQATVVVIDHWLGSPVGLRDVITRFITNLNRYDLKHMDLRRLRQRIRLKMTREFDVFAELGITELPEDLRPIIEACYRATMSYRPPICNNRVVLLRARSFAPTGPWPPSEDYGWSRVAKRTEVHVIDGMYHKLLEFPVVQTVATRLDALLKEA